MISILQIKFSISKAYFQLRRVCDDIGSNRVMKAENMEINVEAIWSASCIFNIFKKASLRCFPSLDFSVIKNLPSWEVSILQSHSLDYSCFVSTLHILQQFNLKTNWWKKVGAKAVVRKKEDEISVWKYCKLIFERKWPGLLLN